ncbi:GGDEF domain-containing phosphodiesterase [Vibrio sp. 99-70-13A1]|uniref:putative bifunctional diguanylate cyclase/phosphodiesterase n=1 Tax=Vibrio sp. 99-70-13A1 TaxID=2607601 RepID=UPI001493A6A1|nr:GGDEF domain-containing phosphodiesterase [Vibrio sp. 99-70-13A1]NOH95524.1 EAL domain-containing protein [Vibrio sp. 99-70-13A1]
MNLTQRVKFFLLPIIILTFTTAGYLSFKVFKQHQIEHHKQFINYSLSNLYESLRLEDRSNHSQLSTILNNPEFIRVSHEVNWDYLDYSLNPSIYSMIARSVENSSTQSLHITDSRGQILLAFDDNDPFSEVQLPLHTDDFVKHALQIFLLTSSFTTARTLFRGSDGRLKTVYARSFSPRLLQRDTRNKTNEYLIAIQVASLDSFATFQNRMRQEFGSEVTFSLQPEFFPGHSQEIKTNINVILNEDNSLTGSMDGGAFFYSLKVPKHLVERETTSSFYFALISAICMSGITYVFLLWVIKNQIINPILSLESNVRETTFSGENKLILLDKNDEVSKLNNAYYNLVSNLEHLASRDVLTDLANRRQFETWLEDRLKFVYTKEGKNKKQQAFALLFIDLDKFKQVNDHHGHETGDKLLQIFSKRLTDVVKAAMSSETLGGSGIEFSSIARLAGDEFAVALPKISGLDEAEFNAQQIIAMFDGGFEVDGISHDVKASIGIAMYTESISSASHLLRCADTAMYQAKANGRNRYEVFTEELANKLKLTETIESTLIDELLEDQLELYYMPIFESCSLALVGYETLLRSPKLMAEDIGPETFIPIAESSSLIKKIDLWVLDRSLFEFKQLRSEGFTGYLSLNISSVELKNKDFAPQVALKVKQSGIEPSLIHLEITETKLSAPDADSVYILNRLRDIGVKLVLDDFGTGYTAFNQLVHYPVDCLKIDRSFVCSIEIDHHKKMVEIIITLAQLYDLEVVAEGIENKIQLNYLVTQGCQLVQGNFLSHPLPLEQFKDRFIRSVSYSNG